MRHLGLVSIRCCALVATMAFFASAHAQVSSAYGWVDLSESWTGGSDVWVDAYNGSQTWNYTVNAAETSASNYNLSDDATYLISGGSSALYGPAYDYSGAENVMY